MSSSESNAAIRPTLWPDSGSSGNAIEPGSEASKARPIDGMNVLPLERQGRGLNDSLGQRPRVWFRLWHER